MSAMIMITSTKQPTLVLTTFGLLADELAVLGGRLESILVD